MQRIPTVCAVGALTAMMLLPGAAAAQESKQSRPVVEPARQVTTDPAPDRLYVSPDIAVDPSSPETVVIGVGDARNGGCRLYVSYDAGLTFGPTSETFMPSDLPYCVQLNGGPVMELAFAPDGELYVATAGSSLERDHPRGPVDALTIRTENLGRTSESFIVEKAEDIPYTTKEGEAKVGTSSLALSSVAVDSEDPERIYRSFRYRTRGPSGVADRPRLAVSNDGGRTWEKSIDPLDTFDGEVFGGDVPMLVAGRDGAVYGFTRERIKRAPEGEPPNLQKQRIFMSKSTDGGKSWVTTVAFDQAEDLYDPGVAIDPTNGNIYVVFESAEKKDGLEYVFFMSSADEGATWSEPIRVTDDKGLRHNQSFPGISVAPNGRIDLAWHDFRNDPFFTPEGDVDQRYSDVYGATSTDGGKTFSDNFRISDRSIDRKIGSSFDNEDLRAPIGVASTDDAAMITWPDSRAGAPPEFDVEDAYFTRVRFNAGVEQSAFDVSSALLGVAATLAVTGLVFVVITRLRPKGDRAAGPTRSAPAAAS